MKRAVVLLRGIKTGILTEDEHGYTFEYDTDYLMSDKGEFNLQMQSNPNWLTFI